MGEKEGLKCWESKLAVDTMDWCKSTKKRQKKKKPRRFFSIALCP